MAIEEDLPYSNWRDTEEDKENRKKVREIVKKIVAKATELFGDKFCVLGAEDLKIEWVNEGTGINIKEHDGFERVEYCQGEWIIA